MMTTPRAARRGRTLSGAPPRLTLRLLPAVAAASLLVLTGCVPVVSTGPMASEEREIGAVTAVTLDTSGNLSVSEGEPGLVIHAPSDALDLLTSDVDGAGLRLATTPGAQIFGQIRYELTVPELESISVNGSGDVDSTVSSAGGIRIEVDGSGDVIWTDLDTDRVTVQVAGSGDVEVAGTTAELEIEVDGSGDVDARELRAQDSVVSVAGSGDVHVSAEDTLSAEISGSGQVTYSGDPEVRSDVSGSGDVVRGE